MSPLSDAIRRNSDERLVALRTAVSDLSTVQELTDLAIYVTGSYGRREASVHSDLDLFFVNLGTQRTNAIPSISKTLLDADLIRLTEDMAFPPFSGDGEYLQIHYLSDIGAALGSPKDDWYNFFTARLLLLLESTPVWNDGTYDQIQRSIVEMYYRDYHDHVSAFRPLFLVNDVVRFWKTLCLNYEHSRGRPPTDPDKRNRNHLKNLKLKFSRLLTCYSTILPLAARGAGVGPDDVLSLVALPPLVRLELLADTHKQQELLKRIETEYQWFLETVQRPRAEVLDWIAEKANRDEAFNHARAFGQSMYELLIATTADDDTMRYLVI